MIVVVAGLAAAATALSFPASSRLPSRRLQPRSSPWAVAALLLPVLVLTLHGSVLVLGLLGSGTAFALTWLAKRSRSRKGADVTRLQVIEACEALASELRAGQPPPLALARASTVWSTLEPVVAAARLDADVPSALRRAAAAPGAAALAAAASAWSVSQSVGGGLAQALDRVVDQARAELTTHRLVASELAAAQATARTVAVLPVLVLLLSGGTGADPFRFLLETPAGLGCLGGGLAMTLIGLAWIERIVTRVEAREL